jgi:hypothetical protein
MAQDKIKFNLRLPGDLYAKVAASAEARVPQLSVNQELTRRIHASFEIEDLGWGDEGVDVGEVLDAMREQIAKAKRRAEGLVK